jgi:hypothetical protein
LGDKALQVGKLAARIVDENRRSQAGLQGVWDRHCRHPQAPFSLLFVPDAPFYHAGHYARSIQKKRGKFDLLWLHKTGVSLDVLRCTKTNIKVV